jgi:hypothetical protein
MEGRSGRADKFTAETRRLALQASRNRSAFSRMRLRRRRAAESVKGGMDENMPWGSLRNPTPRVVPGGQTSVLVRVSPLSHRVSGGHDPQLKFDHVIHQMPAEISEKTP